MRRIAISLLRRAARRRRADHDRIAKLEQRLGLLEAVTAGLPVKDERLITDGAAHLAALAGLELDQAAAFGQQWAALEAPAVPDMPPVSLGDGGRLPNVPYGLRNIYDPTRPGWLYEYGRPAE